MHGEQFEQHRLRNRERSQAAVEERLTAFADLMRRNQFVDSIEAFHTADVRTYENQMEVPDLAALKSLFGEVAKTMKVDSFSFRTREMFVHDNGTVVYQLGDFQEVLSSRGGQAAPVSAHNNFIIRWVKGPDGVWRTSRLIATPAPPSGGRDP